MTVKEAINKRYSTRYYDVNKKVRPEVINDIVEAGYLAPNGLGSEPWKFIVIEGDLSKLEEAVRGQKHVIDSSFVVAFVNYKKELVDECPEVLTGKFARMGLDEDKQQHYLEYAKALGTQYYREQLMFAAGQMCLQAVEYGVGSVIVGGFDSQKMAEILNIDTNKYEVGLLVDFGIPLDQEMKKRVRRDKNEVISYKKI